MKMDCRRLKNLNPDIQKNFDGKEINNLNQTKCRINDDETDDYEPEQLSDFSNQSDTSDEDIDRVTNFTKRRTIGKVGQKVHYCDEPECHFKARSRCELKEHQMCVHSDETPYVCEFPGCGKAFKITRYLKKTHEKQSLRLRNSDIDIQG